MNQHRMRGDYVVCGVVTGTHMIEDIKVPVPHQVAVRIPAALAHRSKDLWRGLQQKRLFLLKGGSGLSVVEDTTTPAPATAPDTLEQDKARLEQENARLREELEASRAEATELRQALGSQGDKLEAILTAIGRLEGGQVQVTAGLKAAVEAVGGEVPHFIPSEDLKGSDTEASIQVGESRSEGSTVADAASRLRSLRGKKTG